MTFAEQLKSERQRLRLTACNAHHGLVEALQVAEATIQRKRGDGIFSDVDGTLSVIRKVLAQLEGGK